MPSSRRKVALATWRPSRDGRIFGRFTVDARPALAYAAELTATTGVRVTVTHVVGRAVALGLAAVPEFGHRVVFGRLVRYPRVDVSFAVDIEDGVDLGPAVVRDADHKSTVDVARELAATAAALRAGADRDFSMSNRIVRALPWFALRPAFAVASTWNGGLGRRAFGQPGFPLGGALVTNVGSLGLDEAFVAPLPFARAPLYVAVGAVRDEAAVEDGRVVPRPTLHLCATADHRVVDGAHAGRLASVLRAHLADPEGMDRAPGVARPRAGRPPA